jgi:uncharacterized protein YgiM (DUF1202 family)
MRLTRAFKILLLLCLSLFVFNIAPAQESFPFRGEVNANKINVRIDSTVSSQIICTLDSGARVDVVWEFYDWYKIRLPKFSPCFVKKDLTACINYKQADATRSTQLYSPSEQCRSAKILKDNVNVRLSPSESSPIIGEVHKNEVVNILKESQGWYRIEPVLNSFGWINKRFISKASEEKKIETAELQEAKQETQNEPDSEALKQALVTLTGTVNPYGKIFKRQATHKLLTQDQRIFLLKGDKKSLDALNYHKVRVTGSIINSARQKYPIVEVKKIEVIN